MNFNRWFYELLFQCNICRTNISQIQWLVSNIKHLIIAFLIKILIDSDLVINGHVIKQHNISYFGST